MKEEVTVIERMLSFSKLTIHVRKVGADYHIIMQGGEKPHIGSAVLAIPRPSLTGNGTVSATSSVLNVTGHKDEELCRYLAETVARRCQGVVVCVGGFHMDHITSEQIQEVMEVVRNIAWEIPLVF